MAWRHTESNKAAYKVRVCNCSRCHADNGRSNPGHASTVERGSRQNPTRHYQRNSWLNRSELLELCFLHAQNNVLRPQNPSGPTYTQIATHLADSHFCQLTSKRRSKNVRCFRDSQVNPLGKRHHRVSRFDPKALSRYCIF